MKTIYVYTTKTYREKGWYKIGETERLVVDRVKQQDTTSNPELLEIIFEVNSVISDKEIHSKLEEKGFSKCRNNREWFEGFNSSDDVIFTINEIISESENDTRPIYEARFYQDYVNMLFIDKLEKSNNEKVDFALELAPRFGKTIWTIDLVKTLFTDFNYKICFLPSYVLTSLSSFKNDLYKFNGYSNDIKYVSMNEDVTKIVDKYYGKKMIVVETSLHMNEYQDKLNFVSTFPRDEKVCIMDEADFGTHRMNSQNVIRFIDSKLNVYMTGTAIERVINPLENLEDNIIRWSYTDMLLVKKGEHPLQKYLVK